MEQLIFLLLIALISFINWLMQRSAELREKRKLERAKQSSAEDHPYHVSPEEEPEPAPVRRSQPAPDPQAEMRKLMEALGLPMEEEPPKVEEQRPAPPPLPSFPSEPLPRPEPVFVAPPPPARPKTATQRTAAAVVTSGPTPNAAIMSVLRSRDGARQAIVLREILGPPKAFCV